MKKLTITWDNIADSTGYLFSFAKSLACAVKNSPYSNLAEDIIATSGFAFRMWVSPDLCPSATSIWSFREQKPWVENGGLTCNYTERLWNSDDIEEKCRLAAIEQIKQSIDNGIAAISWDIGVPEWGLITGYDDETQKFATLSINGSTDEMEYALLGKRELPILNVLTITGKSEKSTKNIIEDTIKLAKNHLTGGEWCENASGLKAYPALIRHLEGENTDLALSWNMEYFLGTYAALKWYAWKFFKKYQLLELAACYKNVFDCWQKAFELKKASDLSLKENRATVANLLKKAETSEKNALNLMN
ncbi:MAG: hypothetical protein K1W00_05090 [Lachnospiraceae bacterium]